MYKCTNVQMYKCTNVQMYKCTKAQIYKYDDDMTLCCDHDGY